MHLILFAAKCLYFRCGSHVYLKPHLCFLALMGLFMHILQSKPLKHLNSQVCQICANTVGLTGTGDAFVACNECAFPVCQACYEYERKDGNQSCPQCKTRYKRHKGVSSFLKSLCISFF